MISIVLAALITAGLANDGHDLVLLQMRAEKLGGSASPELGSKSSASSDAYEELGSHIHAFESSVLSAAEQQQSELKAHKAQFALQLTKQHKTNTAIAAAISSLKQDIKHLQDSNSQLRQRAVNGQTANHRSIVELRLLEANLSLAQEFIGEALEDDVDEPELNILKELDSEDKARSETEEHRNHLDEVAGKKLVAFLETHDKDPKDLLRSLEEHLTGLVEEHSVAEASLKARFEVKMNQLTNSDSELSAERDQMTSSKATLAALQERLQAAVQHVEDKHANLAKKIGSLKSFVHNLGNDHSVSQSGLALLQRGSTAPDSDTSVRLAAPVKPAVVQNLSSQIRALQQTVERNQQETDAALATQKASYEHKLKTQHLTNSKAATLNVKLSKEIADLKHGSTALQQQASDITESNRLLHDDIRALKANFTTSNEYAEKLLEELHSASKSSKLDVLEELNEKSVALAHDEAHSQRLQSISTVSLLQPAVGKPAGDEAGEITHLLQGSLEAMSSEASERAAMLKQEFDTKYGAGAKRYDELMTEQATLEKEKSLDTKLKSSLEAAVEFLTAENTKLEQGVQSLKGFSRRMGAA